jgi:hypothetical protein
MLFLYYFRTDTGPPKKLGQGQPSVSSHRGNKRNQATNPAAAGCLLGKLVTPASLLTSLSIPQTPLNPSIHPTSYTYRMEQ